MPPSLRSPRHQLLIEPLIVHREEEESGPKQADVVAWLGRHQPFISNIDSGQRRVNIVELLDLADAIGFDSGELIRRFAGRRLDGVASAHVFATLTVCILVVGVSAVGS